MTDILKKILEEGYLGKTTDREVAKMYGIDPRTVSTIRATAGIPVFSSKPYGGKRTGEVINGVDRARLEQVIKTVEEGYYAFGDREMAVMYAAKKEGLKPRTVQTYISWAKSKGVSMSSDVRPKDHKNIAAERLDAIEKMLINVASTQTTILSTLRNKGIIE